VDKGDAHEQDKPAGSEEAAEAARVRLVGRGSAWRFGDGPALDRLGCDPDQYLR